MGISLTNYLTLRCRYGISLYNSLLICEDDNLTMKINNALLENYFEQRRMRKPEIVLKRTIDLDTEQDLFKNIDIVNWFTIISFIGNYSMI